MESLVAKGLVKAIGISNFTITKTEKLIETAKIVPAVNQGEIQVYTIHTDVTEHHQLNAILTSSKRSSKTIVPLKVCNFLKMSLSVHTVFVGIILEAYAPLGSPGRPRVNPGDPVVMEDPTLKQIAEKHGATVGQVSYSKIAFYYAISFFSRFAYHFCFILV